MLAYLSWGLGWAWKWLKLPKCPSSDCFYQDSAAHLQISSMLENVVARPLLEKTFHLRVQSGWNCWLDCIIISVVLICRKVFTQRESCERLLAEHQDKLEKVGYAAVTRNMNDILLEPCWLQIQLVSAFHQPLPKKQGSLRCSPQLLCWAGEQQQWDAGAVLCRRDPQHVASEWEMRKEMMFSWKFGQYPMKSYWIMSY